MYDPLLNFLTAKTTSTPRSYEYKELQYSWRSPRLVPTQRSKGLHWRFLRKGISQRDRFANFVSGKTQDDVLKTALAGC